jgi:hypothetical protein
MPPNSKPHVASVSEVPEVSAFVETLAQLEAFKTQNSMVFDQYEQIVGEYNQKLEAAEKMVRQLGVSCGPFDLYQFNTSYDPKALYDTVGHDRFLQVGGSVHTEKVYKVDKAKVEVAIQQGRVPPEAIEAFKTVSPRYHKPNKVTP